MTDGLLHHELERGARWRPGEPAIRFEGTTYTYRELDSRVNRLARRLREDGLAPGDAVVVHGDNHVDLYTAYFATSKAGLAFSPVSTFQSPSNVRAICAELDPKAVLYAGGDEVRTGTLPVFREASEGATFVSLDPDPPDGDPTLAEFLAGTPSDRPGWADDHSPETTHGVFWTSGTTGVPKGALHDHASELHFADPVVARIPHSPNTRRVITYDLMTVTPYMMNGLPVLTAGGTLIVMRSFDPGRLCELIETHDATAAGLSFTASSLLIEYLEDHDRELSLRHLDAVLPDAEHARRLAGHAETLYQTYGSTEAGIPCLSVIEPPFDAKPPIGVPGRGVDMRLADPDDGEFRPDPLAPGDRGELVVRGATTMERYLREENQRRSVADGWFFTGDEVRIDDGGELVFVGRVDDRLRSGGVNVYPAEVESALADHPAVERAVVVGVDDETWGDRICALVVADEEAGLADALDDHCRSHEALPEQLRPREYAFVESADAVPRGQMDKIDRDAVVATFFA